MHPVCLRIVEDRPAVPEQALVALQPVAVRAQGVWRHVEGLGAAEYALVAPPVPVRVLEPGVEAGARFDMPGITPDQIFEPLPGFGGQVFLPGEFPNLSDELRRPGPAR